MVIKLEFDEIQLVNDFVWLNEPKAYYIDDYLEINTDKETDFWQRTHYGFKVDNGHFLYKMLDGDITFVTRVEYDQNAQYDQCGLMVRSDSQNWIKISAEWENEELSRLGSVVTNLGYSDWATQEICSEIRQMFYRVARRGDDFLIDYSYDGDTWLQMRVTHLHEVSSHVQVGFYACSPKGEGFTCRFTGYSIED